MLWRLPVIPDFFFLTVIETAVLLGMLKALKYFYTHVLIYVSLQNVIVEVDTQMCAF